MRTLRIPVLTYHSIDNSGSVISVSPSRFRNQMKSLKDVGLKSISLKEIIERVSAGKELPEKSVVITFDDGYKNFYSEGFPILKELGFTATIFLVTGNCGKANEWDGQSKNIPILSLLSWDEIIEMANKNIDFGAHTVSHPNLSDLSIENAAKEIYEAKAMIKERLGQEHMFLAYPYGIYDDNIKNIVKKEFCGACSAEMGFATLKSDIYSLPRIEMYYFSQNNFFKWIETSFFPFYVKVRSIPRFFK